MADLQNSLMPQIWGSSGAAITTPSNDKIVAGWSLEPVPLQWLNWFFNRVDNNVAYLLQKGIPEWKVGQEYIADKSYVQYRDTNGVYNVYRCKVTHVATNDNRPSIGGSNWGIAFTKATPVTEAIAYLSEDINALPNGTKVLTGLVKNGAGVYVGEASVISPLMQTALTYTTLNAIQTNLQLQASSPRLSAIANGSGFDSGVNKLFYSTGNTAASGAYTTLSPYIRTLLDDSDAATARSTLGLGSVSTQNANAVSITGGSITGITDLAIVDGGTGASNATDARNNLGIKNSALHSTTASPTDAITDYDADRSELKVLLQGDGGILGDIKLLEKVGGVFPEISGLPWGTVVAYYGTKTELVAAGLPDLGGGEEEFYLFVVSVVGGGFTGYIRAVEVGDFSTVNPTGSSREFIKFTSSDGLTPWYKIFNSGNLLDIGTTPATARTALQLANSATIPASTTNDPFTLVQRTAGNVIVANVVGNVTGIADYASRLSTPKTINGTTFNNTENIVTARWGNTRSFTFTGDATGTLTTDGSGNITSVPLTLKNSGVVAGIYGGTNKTPSITVDAQGRITSISVLDISLPVAQITGILPIAKGGTGTATSVGTGSLVLSTNPKIVSPKGAISTLSSNTINTDTGSIFKYTVTSSGVTFSITGSVSSNTSGSFILELTNGGSGLVTWPSNVKWASGSPPLLTTAGVDSIGFYYNGTDWVGYLVGRDIK